MYEVLLDGNDGAMTVNVTELTLNLTQFGSFNVSVRAHNTVGVGPYSKSVWVIIPPPGSAVHCLHYHA